MRSEEVVYPNDTTESIRKIMRHLEDWRENNQRCDQYYTDRLLDKLEEAELLSLRMVKEDE